MNMKKTIATFMSAMGLSVAATPLAEDGLQALWSATSEATLQKEAGTEGTHEVTYVNAWTSSGSCAVTLGCETNKAERPYFCERAFRRADGTHAASVRMNGRPYADLWDGSSRYQHLYTAPGTAVDFNLGNDVTWFFLANVRENSGGMTFWGFTMGEGGDTPARIGMFSPGSDGSNFRSYALNNELSWQGNYGGVYGNPILCEARMASSTMTVWRNGWNMTLADAQKTYPAHPARFEIGAHHNLMEAQTRPSMDVGALVIYNRALNDAEMVIARATLCAEFGITLSDDFRVYEGGSASAGHWIKDVVGVGSTTTGELPGRAAVSGWSADCLRLEVASGLDGDGDYVFAARQNGVEGWTYDATLGDYRTVSPWRLERHGTSTGSVRVSLRMDSNETGLRYTLVMKKADDEAYEPVAAEAASDTAAGIVSFVLADEDLKDGTLLALLRQGGTVSIGRPTARFRADMGVAAGEDGVVTKWKNQGSLGEAIDVSSFSGRVMRVVGGLVRADGTRHDLIRFPGYGFLRSTEQTTLGITDEVSLFMTVYPTDLDGRGDAGHPVFGLESVSWERLGPYVLHNGKVRGFVNGRYHEFGTLSNNDWFLADFSRSGKTIDGSVNGNPLTATTGNDAPATATTYFAIGDSFAAPNWEYYNPPFVGDIAEVRVYNRRLDDMERLIVREKMLSYCGRASAGARFASSEADAQGCDRDLAAVGSLSESAGVPAVRAQDTSAELSLAATEKETLTVGCSVVFAHNGLDGWTTDDRVRGGAVSERLARVWRIVRTGTAGTPLRLSFSMEAQQDGKVPRRSRWRLLYRASASDAFRVQQIEPVVSGNVVTFTLSEVNTGFYTLANVRGGIVFIIR